jgi:hypothetical protein
MHICILQLVRPPRPMVISRLLGRSDTRLRVNAWARRALKPPCALRGGNPLDDYFRAIYEPGQCLAVYEKTRP